MHIMIEILFIQEMSMDFRFMIIGGLEI